MNEQINYKEIISRYIDGETTSAENDMIERKLKEDASLKEFYLQLRGLDQLLDERPNEALSRDWEQNVASSFYEVDSREDKKMNVRKLINNAVSGGVLAIILVACLLSTQVYIKRGVQGRLKQASDDIGDQFSVGIQGRWKAAGDSLGNYYDPRFGMGTEVSTEAWNTEEYARIYEKGFLKVLDNPLSTFSIDVDTGAYSNVRRFLNMNQLPPVDAVRVEEMINYFTYNYAAPTDGAPFAVHIDAAKCPWKTDHQLVRVALKGKTLNQEEIPPSNLVFLIDVSGSMDSPNKLPLVKKSLKMLVKQLRDDQRVAIVVYAGAAGKVLESTPGSNKRKIFQAIDRLKAGGSTAGGAGIKLAYKMAAENYIEEGNNRVILVTDGDFNTGVSSTSEMINLIEEKREEGVFITVLGYGMGNYKDGRLEQIANNGNGTYHYVDSEKEARKVFVEELGSTLFTISKDVKLQIEFNPAQVKAYRLLGYENRRLTNEEFNDDTKDAGELGAGHTVTAFYEIVPADSTEQFGSVDELSYQKAQTVQSDDLMTVKLRYKEPDGNKSKLIKKVIQASDIVERPRGDFQFAAAVVEFGMILRHSKYRANANYEHVLKAAQSSKGKDEFGYRAEFINLVKKADSIDQRPAHQKEYDYDEDDENDELEYNEDGASDGTIRFK